MVHNDMMQEQLNETAPKVPDSTSDAAFTLKDLSDLVCNYDAAECDTLMKEAEKATDKDSNSVFIKQMQARAKSVMLWSTY